MTEKRYYQKRYEEEFYIFDSENVSEKDFDNKFELVGYKAFEDSLTDEEVVELLNENEQLKKSDTITDLETQIMKLKNENERLQHFESRYRERNLKLEKENKELKTVLNKTLKQLYNAQVSLIWEYGNITEEEKQLKEHFKEKYGKYGWKE